MDKPKILFIATFPPPIHGSAVVSQQIKDSIVINNEFDGDYVNLGSSRTIDEIGKAGFFIKIKKLFRFIGTFIKTFSLLLLHKYDLCYCAITCRGAGFLKDAPIVLLCKLFRRKIVIHQHNKGMSKYINRPLYRWLLPLVYKNAKVILLSWELYPDIENVVKKENVFICPNGIKPTLNEEIIHNPTLTPHILFLSNLITNKGVFVLLDALKILRGKGYSFICDFVGSESQEINTTRFLKEIEDRGLKDYIIYHGSKYGHDKYKFYIQADIFVLPSFDEAFPLVIIEAMEYKLPIVSTNVGGIPDEVNNGYNGFLVEPNDVNALVNAIESLLINPELRLDMGFNSRSIFEDCYTETRFEKCMKICLDNCINN